MYCCLPTGVGRVVATVGMVVRGVVGGMVVEGVVGGVVGGLVGGGGPSKVK